MSNSTTLADLLPSRRSAPRDPVVEAARRQVLMLRPAALAKGAVTGLALYILSTQSLRGRRRH